MIVKPLGLVETDHRRRTIVLHVLVPAPTIDANKKSTRISVRMQLHIDVNVNAVGADSKGFIVSGRLISLNLNGALFILLGRSRHSM